MEDVGVIGKDSRNTTQNFNFRGVDAVVDRVGPVLRRHGVIVVPRLQSMSSERYKTKSGAEMIGRTVEVCYRVYGPNGDFFDGSVAGEASDSGDKATPKAMSVAYRTFLLQALAIPTGETDPDAYSYVRATPSDGARDRLRTLATSKGWDLGRVAQVFSELVGGDLRSASDVDVDSFRESLEAGDIAL